MADPQRLRPGDTVRIRTERWVVQQQTVVNGVPMVDVRGADTGNAGERARFLLPFDTIEPLAISPEPRVVRRREWRRVTRTVLESVTPRVDSLRAAVRARFDVLPFQLEPALAVTAGHGCRLLIADDVGLGKTVQAGLLVAEVLERYPGGRALVVCPAGLRSQWQAELRDRFDLDAVVLDADGVARLTSAFDETVNPWSAAALVIASIDYIKRPEVIRALEGLVWDAVVLDEAHNLSTQSDRASAAAAIAARARVVVMLSATPHSGDETAFARLCSIGDVRGRFPLILFRRTRADAGIPVQRRTRWHHVSPTAAEARVHTALIEYARRVWREPGGAPAGRLAMTVLMRRAASSSGALARSLERRLAALSRHQIAPIPQLQLPFERDGDDEPSATVTSAALADASEEREYVEHVLELAHDAAGHESKVAVLLRWLRRVRQPVLVFTEYRDTLTQLRQAIVGSGFAEHQIVELHGGLTRSERDIAAQRFRKGEADLLLATDAASEGLNLHHRCRCVINLEIPWSPVRLEQRIGRIDRIGQHRRVHALHLVAANSYETRVVQRLLDRARAASMALSETPPSPESTADFILTGIDNGTAAPSALPDSIRRLDLSAQATSEASRIIAGRVLRRGPSNSRSRPVITVIGRQCGCLLCGFEICIVDSGGQPLWSTAVGIEASVATTDPRIPADVRGVFARARLAVLAAATAAASDLAGTIAADTAGLVRLATEREQAIAAAVRLRHARIAADLLQPGLFDRRAERQSAAQSAVLEEALGRCHDRLELLARQASLTADTPALRFALFRR